MIVTFGAVHSVTASRLAEEAKRFAPRVDTLPHPRIAVLLGGESQAFSFPPDAAPPSAQNSPRSPGRAAALFS